MAAKQGVIPCILSPDCDKHIEWIETVFGGEVKELFRTNDGKKVMHCTMAVNDGVVSLGDGVCPCTPAPTAEQQPKANTGGARRGAHCHLEVEKEERLNEIWKNAQSNGATVVVEIGIQSWGDLYGMFKDPFGFEWAVEKPVGHVRKPGVVPYLLTSDCEKYIELLKTVLGAEVRELYHSDDKKRVQHCSLAVNDYFVYLSDPDPSTPEQQVEDPQKLRQFLCHLDVEDPQVIWQKAMDRGAKTVVDLKVQSWGDLLGAFIDTFRFEWSVAKLKQPAEPDVGVIPTILSPDGDKHLEWIKDVFGAEENFMYRDETTKKIIHCSLKVNKGMIYLSDGSCMSDQKDSLLPPGTTPRGVVLHLNVQDPDVLWKKALEHGASKVVELKVQFWGDIYGSFRDPFGYEWSLCASATPKQE